MLRRLRENTVLQRAGWVIDWWMNAPPESPLFSRLHMARLLPSPAQARGGAVPTLPTSAVKPSQSLRTFAKIHCRAHTRAHCPDCPLPERKVLFRPRIVLGV